MGAFHHQRLTPGPSFKERPDLVWGGDAKLHGRQRHPDRRTLPFVGLWARLLRLPYRYDCVGTLFVSSAPIACSRACLMLRAIVCGVIGYGLHEDRSSAAPPWSRVDPRTFIEKSLRTSLEMSGGDFSIFYAADMHGLLLAAIVVLVGSLPRRAPPEVRDSKG
jgi:TctA family transporter